MGALTAPKIGERMVEHNGANPPRLPKIVFRALHGVRADRKAAVLTSPMDGTPQVVRFDATTLWHFDAAVGAVHSIKPGL